MSVVTPCLEPGERLVRCLASVAAQTYRHVEHVVVDGGSTDGSVERLREAGVRHVSEPDQGQTNALNKGFALASGDIVGWLNADDELTPRAVEHVVTAFGRNPGADFAYGDCEVCEDGRRILLWRPPRKVDLARLELGDPIPQPGSFVRRGALERVLPLDENFHLAMDFELWLRLLSTGARGVYVPRTLARFEVHGTSKTGTIGRAAFFEEEERALVTHGRLRAAALARGRVAAAAAAERGSALRDELRSVERRAPPLSVRRIRAAAYAETAVIESRSSLRGLRLLARPEPWLYPQTRRRLREGARRGAARILARVFAPAVRKLRA